MATIKYNGIELQSITESKGGMRCASIAKAGGQSEKTL